MFRQANVGTMLILQMQRCILRKLWTASRQTVSLNSLSLIDLEPAFSCHKTLHSRRQTLLSCRSTLLSRRQTLIICQQTLLNCRQTLLSCYRTLLTCRQTLIRRQTLLSCRNQLSQFLVIAKPFLPFAKLSSVIAKPSLVVAISCHKTLLSGGKPLLRCHKTLLVNATS